MSYRINPDSDNQDLLDNPAKVLIAYHAHCTDGFTAAWIAAKAIAKKGLIYDMLPMEYSIESETRLLTKLTKGDYIKLYVLDYSLTLDALSYLEIDIPELKTTILDHHKTALERYVPNHAPFSATSKVSVYLHGARVHLDMGLSGAGMAWNHFNPNKDVPDLVRFVQDYDLYLFNLGYATRYVAAYLKLRPKTIAEWDMAEANLIHKKHDTFEAGRVIHDAHVKQCKALADTAVNIVLPTKAGHLYTGLVVNCHGQYASKVGELLAQRSGTFGATFFQDEAGGKFKWSLRAKDNVDVSDLAGVHGGGGHKNASGFILTPIQHHRLVGNI